MLLAPTIGEAAVAVSIRARPIGRAMQRQGATNTGARDVSIRARPIGRAMRLSGGTTRPPRSFQSAPGRLAGRCSTNTDCYRKTE